MNSVARLGLALGLLLGLSACVKVEAGERGGEALVLTGTKDATTITATNRTGSSTQNSRYRGTCVVFTDSEAAPAASTSTSSL